MTGETGPEIIERRGDPSSQWVVTGIDNPEVIANYCEEGIECEVGINEYSVYSAFPYP